MWVWYILLGINILAFSLMGIDNSVRGVICGAFPKGLCFLLFC